MADQIERADWAVEYAQRGWPVLPLHTAGDGRCSCGNDACPSPAKHPRVPHGLKEATANPTQVAQWWKRWPDANIGLRTGDAFDVLDIDGQEGAQAMANLYGEHGELPESCPAAATGGGGIHLLFAPTGLGNRAALVPHVDWRGAGGYIVAPPSRHASGADYRWINNRWLTGDLPAVPDWLRLILDPPRPARTTPAGRRPPGDSNAYVQKAMDAELGELARAPEGMRNHQLNISGFNLFQLVGGGELPGELVENELRRVALTIGLGAREIDATIGSARKAGLARPRCAPPPRYIRSAPAPATNGTAPARTEEPPPPGDEDAPPEEQAGPPRHNLTDVGNAARLVDLHGQDLRHVRAWSSWLVWDGRRWRRDDTGAAVELAKHTARAILTEAAIEEDDDRRKHLVKWSRTSEAASRIHAMLDLARSDPTVALRPDELDTDSWLLTVANGTLDLTSGRLRPHRRSDGITKLVDVPYDPAAAAPTWDRFLAQILPDPAVRDFLRRAVGYSLTGSVREQCLFFLYGLGANGKSTLITTLLALLGDYGRQADPKLLMESKHETHPTNVADLQGARFVATIEAGSGRRLDETLVKQLTGGDRVKARFMRQDFFEFDPTHKLFLAANHKPVIRGNDHAIWRRVHLVPFTVTIAAKDRDDRLGATLLAELPGILRWAVDGCLEWQREGLQPPAPVVEATDAYRAEEDLLGDFLAACCKEEAGRSVGSAELYKAYQRWAEEAGEKAWSQTAFGRAIGERGFEAKKDQRGRKVRIGLALIGNEIQTLDIRTSHDSAVENSENSPNRPSDNPTDSSTVRFTLSAHAHTHDGLHTENGPELSVTVRGPEPDSDPCWACGMTATDYDADGTPHCVAHPTQGQP